ncbi:MAG: DNA polymerase III subunit [Gemmatimonadales bacterium]
MAEPGYLAVFGHEEIRERLARSASLGRLPQSLLLHGPRGVGKQRLALWTAAALNCSAEDDRPCGSCRSCRLSARLEHPDINWFFPLPRPKRASGVQQLRQKLEDLRAAALEERRANPFYLEDEEGATGIYVAAVRTMRRLAQRSPAMGPAKVLIIGRAEALTPGLGSPEAANALLKLLEEPPADTTLILTSDVPGALLPTVRSRVQAVRIAPLPEERIAQFLAAQAHIPAADARRLARRSGGSIGRALELRDEEQESLRESANELVRALLDGRPSAQLAAAHRFRSFGARGAFSRLLGEVQTLLRDILADTAGATASDPEAVAALAGGSPPRLAQLVRLLDAVDEARDLADRNVNPQLIVANLTRLGAGRLAGSSVPPTGPGGT